MSIARSIERVQQQLAAAPFTPDKLGALDARTGYAFAPESYYAHRKDMAMYAAGFLSVEPDNEAALAYMRSVEEEDVVLVTYNAFGDIVS